MNELSALLDPTSLGMDLGRIAAICEITNRAKAFLDKRGLAEKLARWYVFLPIAVGIGFISMTAGMDLSPKVLAEGLKYGIYSTFAWRVNRVAVEKR